MIVSTGRRVGVLVMIPVLLLAAGIVGSHRERPTRATRALAAQPAVDAPSSHLSMMAPAGSLGGVWYCAAGTASDNGVADNRVVAANISAEPATATVTVYPFPAGSPRSVELRIAPHGRSEVRLGDVVSAAFASAVVETHGGQVAVEHEVSGPLGLDIASCLTTASANWSVPSGSTANGTGEVLAILNPFPADAIVNVSFASDNGAVDRALEHPSQLQGVPVAGQSLLVVDVTDNFSARSLVSASVQSTSGQVVVEQLFLAGATGRVLRDWMSPTYGYKAPDVAASDAEILPAPGMTLTPAVSAPATTWYFPDGRKQDGGHERYVVFNPSSQPADVQIDIMLNQAKLNGGPVAPFVLSGIAPGEFASVDVDNEARIPLGVEHSATIHSTNGVPVVAERVIQATPPWGRTGAAVTTGSPVTATKWVMVEGGTPPPTDQYVVIMNPGKQAAHVRLHVFYRGSEVDPGSGGQVTVAAGDRAVISVRTLTDLPQGGFASMVESDQPVVVERALFELLTTGMANTLAIPSPDGAQLPHQ